MLLVVIIQVVKESVKFSFINKVIIGRLYKLIFLLVYKHLHSYGNQIVSYYFLEEEFMLVIVKIYGG
jgi:hypothetical protein